YFGTGDRKHIIYGPLIIANKTMQPKQVETITIDGIEIPVDACWLETNIFGIEQDFAGKTTSDRYIQERIANAKQIYETLIDRGIIPHGLTC
ncbi:MAG: hypothetical protein V1870_02280, partial [Candidatus Aenigmatarchaeota archaeon]